MFFKKLQSTVGKCLSLPDDHCIVFINGSGTASVLIWLAYLLFSAAVLVLDGLVAGKFRRSSDTSASGPSSASASPASNADADAFLRSGLNADAEEA